MTNFNSKNEEPICSLCNMKIKPWAKAQCDGCGRVVCKSHRPMFDFSGAKPKYINYWLCPECQGRMTRFTNPQS
jgi:predicted amidophosphoribosyltransferase